MLREVEIPGVYWSGLLKLVKEFCHINDLNVQYHQKRLEENYPLLQNINFFPHGLTSVIYE